MVVDRNCISQPSVTALPMFALLVKYQMNTYVNKVRIVDYTTATRDKEDDPPDTLVAVRRLVRLQVEH